jgi:ClpP class serine protease
MGREERQELIKDIEVARNSNVITYITSTRPQIRTMIDEPDLRELYDHLLKIDKSNKIDLFIYSLGGAGSVPWAFSNMVREFTKFFTVLIPSLAFSAATAIALGANNIIMGKMGTLGPIDPSVANAFNPVRGGKV